MKNRPFSNVYTSRQFPWRLMTLIFAIAVILSLFSCSPYVTPKEIVYPKPFQFVLTDSARLPKDRLYIKTMEWIAKTYNSAKDVIQMQDKDAGKIVIKAIMKIPVTGVDYETVDYTMTIDVRDGKYRCAITDFNHTGGTYNAYAYTNAYGSLDRDAVYVTTIDLEKELKATPRFRFIKNKCMETSNLYLSDLKTAIASKESDF